MLAKSEDALPSTIMTLTQHVALPYCATILARHHVQFTAITRPRCYQQC